MDNLQNEIVVVTIAFAFLYRCFFFAKANLSGCTVHIWSREVDKHILYWFLSTLPNILPSNWVDFWNIVFAVESISFKCVYRRFCFSHFAYFNKKYLSKTDDLDPDRRCVIENALVEHFQTIKCKNQNPLKKHTHTHTHTRKIERAVSDVHIFNNSEKWNGQTYFADKFMEWIR